MNEKKILVIDDEESIRNLIKKAFSEKDYVVHTAENAEEALEILKNEEFKVMFFDLNLPGMSGLDLCKKIRKKFPKASIFAVTGYASLFELADCRKAGFDDYFTKPIDFERLFKATEYAFEKIQSWENV